MNRLDELKQSLSMWTARMSTENVLVVLGEHIEALESVVNAGRRSVVLSPELVSEAKYIIRSIGAEDEQSGGLDD